MRASGAGCEGVGCLPFACPWCRCVGFRGCSLLLWRVPCLWVAFLLYACRVACKYGSIPRFKGAFSGFWGADVYLYGLRSLRGLWGFCAREWLGGFMACGVFAFHFVFSPCFLSFYLFAGFPSFFLCLSSCLVLSFLLCLCCFFFPYGLHAKRKGAPCWCVLSCPVVGCVVIWLPLG